MGKRTFDRASARKLYVTFSKAWRTEKNRAGQHGKPGFKKPTFSQWFKMHQRDASMMAESTPSDVQEYLGLDPWADIETAPPAVIPSEEVQRGVTTINVAGDEE